MKTLRKFLFAGAAIFISNAVLAQGKSGNHVNAHAQIKTNTTISTSGKTVREAARVNGSLNANAHANINGKNHANENSVLNGRTTTTTKTRVRSKAHKPAKKIHTTDTDNDKSEK